MKNILCKLILLSNIILIFISSNKIAFAQNHQFKDFVGKWLSNDNVGANITKLSFGAQNQPLRFILVIEENDGKLITVLDSPDRYIKTISDETKISGDSITIRFNQNSLSFRGVLNSDKDQLIGNLDFRNKIQPIGFKKENSSEEERQITSQWIGNSLNDMDSLKFVLKTYKTISGAFKACLDLPNKGFTNIMVTNFIVKNDSLKFEAETINGRFEGKILPEKNSIKGMWKHNNREFQVQFNKE